MLSLRRPFDGTYTVTQEYANLNDMEPAGYRYTDGSIGYTWRADGVWGHWHNGVDYGLPCGTPLLAQGDGLVVFAGWDTTGFGNCIVVNHSTVATPQSGLPTGQGYETLCAHLSVLQVRPGAKVKQGQQIGLSGTSGNSTGCHLHNSLRKDGVYLFIGPYLTVTPTPAKPAAAIPPRTASEAAAIMARHLALLDKTAPAAGVNLLVAGVKTWPRFDK